MEEEKEEEKEQEEEEKEQEKVEEGKAHEMLILAVRGTLQAQGWQGSSASSPGCPEHIPWELPHLHQCCLGWCFSVPGFRRMKSKSWQETCREVAASNNNGIFQ